LDEGSLHYLLELILDPLKSIGQGFINYLPSLIFLIIIYLITQYFVRLTRLFFNSIDTGGIVIQNFDSEWAMPTFKIVKFFMIVFAVVVAFPYIPGSSSGFTSTTFVPSFFASCRYFIATG
jgi:hypothetical protein